IFSGNLEQAKRHYGFTASGPAAAEPADADKAAASAGRPEKALAMVRVRRMEAAERVREITVTGRTDVIFDAEVTAETTGRIVEIAASKGTWLEKGDVILKLAVDDRAARLREAEARVTYERIGFDAAKKLAKKGFQSEVKLAQEESELAQAQAALAAIKLDVERTTVRAPISGYLETLPVGVGDYLKSGDKIVVMINPDPIRVVAQVSERDVPNLKPGDAAIARTVQGRDFTGAVRYVAQRADEATRTFRIDAWLDNPDHVLRDGQTMEVLFRAGREKAHKVSAAVLTLNDAGEIGVKYVDDTNHVRFSKVRIIAHTSDGIWLGGLPDTITMITVGQEFVTDGQLVQPVEENSLTAGKGGPAT
ncbi:MAG: efflux RND transporter periplasmic adaptor subunit, partial [Rhodospirillales bacterium]